MFTPQILIPKSLDLAVEMTDEGSFEEVIISNLEPVSSLYKMIADKLDEKSHKIILNVSP